MFLVRPERVAMYISTQFVKSSHSDIVMHIYDKEFEIGSKRSTEQCVKQEIKLMLKTAENRLLRRVL